MLKFEIRCLVKNCAEHWAAHIVWMTSPFLTGWSTCNPHPRVGVRKTLRVGYCLLWNLWLRHLSPALQKLRHSVIKSRLMQSESGPQALSASGEQSHRFLSKGSGFWTTQGGIARLDLILLKWGGLALLGLALDAIAVSRFWRSWKKGRIFFLI